MNTQRHRSRPNREYTQTHFHILFSECQRSIIAKVENDEEIERKKCAKCSQSIFVVVQKKGI